MPVFFREYHSDTEAAEGIQAIKAKGIAPNDIYILTHEDHRTDRIADMADANTVGVAETGAGTAVANLFRKKGDELRAQLQELGFTEEEAERLEEKLDEEKILVVVPKAPADLSI